MFFVNLRGQIRFNPFEAALATSMFIFGGTATALGPSMAFARRSVQLRNAVLLESPVSA